MHDCLAMLNHIGDGFLLLDQIVCLTYAFIWKTFLPVSAIVVNVEKIGIFLLLQILMAFIVLQQIRLQKFCQNPSLSLVWSLMNLKSILWILKINVIFLYCSKYLKITVLYPTQPLYLRHEDTYREHNLLWDIGALLCMG